MTLEECLFDVRAAIKEAQEKGSQEAVIDRRTLIFLEAYVDEITVRLECVKNNLKSMIKDMKEYIDDSKKSD